MSATRAVMLLCLGCYLLGVATSLLSAQFSSYGYTWKWGATLLVVALAAVSLIAGLILIRSREGLQRSGSSDKADVSVREETPASPGTQLAGNGGSRSPRERPMIRREATREESDPRRRGPARFV